MNKTIKDHLKAIDQSGLIKALQQQNNYFKALDQNAFIKTLYQQTDYLETIKQLHKGMSSFSWGLASAVVENQHFLKNISNQMLNAAQMLYPYAKQIATISQRAHETMIFAMKANYPTFEQISSLLQELNDISHDYAFDDDYGNAETLTPQEEQRITEAINDVVSNPKNWQISIVTQINRFKETNPILAKLFILLIYICINLAIATSATVISNGIIRKEPTATSKPITNIANNDIVHIINVMPYYYEVEYADQETGETMTGWISKRSVKINQGAVVLENEVAEVISDATPDKEKAEETEE